MKLAQEIKINGKLYKAGDKSPESEVVRLLMHNREYLELEYKDGWPILTKEEEEKYGIVFPPNNIKKNFKIEKRKYNQESLTIKLNKLGAKEFKLWTEKELGEDIIDRRMTAKAIIVEILRMQEAERR